MLSCSRERIGKFESENDSVSSHSTVSWLHSDNTFDSLRRTEYLRHRYIFQTTTRTIIVTARMELLFIDWKLLFFLTICSEKSRSDPCFVFRACALRTSRNCITSAPSSHQICLPRLVSTNNPICTDRNLSE